MLPVVVPPEIGPAFPVVDDYPPRRTEVVVDSVVKSLAAREMLERLDLPEEILQTSISQYERGKIEPPIFVLLRYADVANVWLDVLLRDNFDLPENLPSLVKHEGMLNTTTIKMKPAK